MNIYENYCNLRRSGNYIEAYHTMQTMIENGIITENQAKKELESLMSRTLNTIEDHRNLILINQTALKKIQSAICDLNGHHETSDNWELKEGHIDGDFYYVKECKICGYEEKTKREPKEYEATRKIIKK